MSGGVGAAGVNAHGIPGLTPVLPNIWPRTDERTVPGWPADLRVAGVEVGGRRSGSRRTNVRNDANSVPDCTFLNGSSLVCEDDIASNLHHDFVLPIEHLTHRGFLAVISASGCLRRRGRLAHWYAARWFRAITR